MSLIVKPIVSDFLLDNLASSTRSSNTVAFSTRLLSQSYTSPVVKIRNTATGTTKDFYANSIGELGDVVGAQGIKPETFLAPKTNAVYLANEANVTISPTRATNLLSATYTVNGSTSFSFWVNVSKFPQSGQFSRVVSYGTTTSQYFIVSTNNNATNNIYIWANGYAGYATINAINTWNHVIGIWTPSSTIAFYFNGTFIGSVPSTSGTLTNGSLIIGDSCITTAFMPFAGYISDFRIYNRALSTPEIQYLAGVSSTPQASITNMTVYLPFQSSTSDLSGNNTTITTTGSVSYVNTTLSLPTLGTVDTWYDQSGNTSNATQTAVGNQPVLIRNSNVYVVRFDTTCTHYMSYGLTGTSSIWNNTNYTAIIKEQRSSNIISIFHGTSVQGINSNLHIGYRSDILFTHAQYGNDYNYTIPGYTGSTSNEPIRRWLVSHHITDNPGKRMYLNGTQVATYANNVSLVSPGLAMLGKNYSTGTASYTGDLYDFYGFNISLPVSDPSAITTIDNYLSYEGRIPRIKMTATNTRKMVSRSVNTTPAPIPPSVINTCVGSYSARKIVQEYNGPIYRIRRDTDNAEADVWIDYTGNVERVVDISLDDGVSTGGTITYDGAYRIHTFTTSGTFTLTQPRVCDVLVVGGGGGGGADGAGGGGGGGVIYKKNFYMNNGNKTVIVGGGGSAGVSTNANAGNGGNSQFDTFIAIGGGGGGGKNTGGALGSSGGGVGHNATGAIPGFGIPRQGKNGGNRWLAATNAGGGGGGASQTGGDATNGQAGNGGNGYLSFINGTLVYYGGGGGGGTWYTSWTGGTGGQGGGGRGGGGSTYDSTLRSGISGTANTGGGGGASGYAVGATIGSGGSGIVIVRTLRHQGLQGRNAIATWLGSSTATLTKWYDQSGNVNHVTIIRGNPRISYSPNDAYLYGTTADGLRFPSAILPTNYTLLHTAQYKTDTFATSKWTITGFTDGSIVFTRESSGGYTYFRLKHGGSPYSGGLTYATYIIFIPSGIMSSNLTLYTNAFIMRTGPSAANVGHYIVDFLDSTNTVVGSSVFFNYTNATLNIWYDSQGSVAVPTSAIYIRLRFGINYNEGIQLRTDTRITIKNSSNNTIAEWYMNESQQRIFDGVNTNWASGFLNNYGGVASHSTSNLNASPANGSVVSSIQGWTGTGVGGSAGPILDRSTTIPHITLNGSSATVGDYFNYGNTTWNLASNSGFTFIGMVKFNTTNSNERIFDFGSGQASNNIILCRSGTSATSLLTSIREGTSNNDQIFTNIISNSSWQIIATRFQNEGGTTWRPSVWNNGVKTAGATFSLALTDKTVTTSYIGRSLWSSDYYTNINMRECLWYNQPLSDAQVTSLYNYMNNKYNNNSAPWMIPPITPYLSFNPYYLIQASPAPFLATNPISGQIVSSINGATGYGVGGNPGPLYDVTTGIPHIAVNGSSTTVGDYLNYGSTTWNLATNGGFTFIGMVRYNDLTKNYVRIYDFGNDSANFVATYSGVGGYINSALRIGGSTVQHYIGAGISAAQWYVISLRLSNISNSNVTFSTFVNNTKYTTSTSFVSTNITDTTYTNNWLGRASDGQAYTNINYRECLWYNQPLSDDQIGILYQYLNNKYNNQSIPWFSTPPITPYLQLNPYSLMQNTYSSNLIFSVDQNTPNLYRANATLYNSTSTNSTSTQLSINYGASGEYSDWIVKDMMVFNNTLSLPNVLSIETMLMRRQLGVLDQILPTVKTTTVAGYAMRLLTISYTGACVKIRRSTDNVQKDFYANFAGELGDQYMGRGQSAKEWLNGATGYINTWYDQTGRAKHLTQATTSLQPTLLFSNTDGNSVYFNNTTMTGPNVFDTTTVTNMHAITMTKEVVRVNNFLLSFNGNNVSTSARTSCHMPWADTSIWYWHGGNTTYGAASTANITSVGQKAVMSIYKSSIDGQNGLRVNSGTRYLSSQDQTATVSGGIQLAIRTGSDTLTYYSNHQIYSVIVFNTKLDSTSEAFLETQMKNTA